MQLQGRTRHLKALPLSELLTLGLDAGWGHKARNVAQSRGSTVFLAWEVLELKPQRYFS